MAHRHPKLFLYQLSFLAWIILFLTSVIRHL
jgi:hypothetical protein